MLTATVGRRGQMTLPAKVRRQLGISEGQQIAFIRRGDEIIVQPLSQTLLDLRGSVPRTGQQDFDTIRTEVRRARGERHSA